MKLFKKYEESVKEKPKGVALGDLDDLILDAARAVIKANLCNIGGMADTFKIGYNRAATICDQLENLGIVTEFDVKTKCRVPLITLEQFENHPSIKIITEYFEEKAEKARKEEEQKEREREEQKKLNAVREAKRKQKFIQECIELGSNPADALVAWKVFQMEERRDAELRAHNYLRQIEFENQQNEQKKYAEDLRQLELENKRREHEENLRKQAAKAKYKAAVRRQYASGVGDISRNLAKYDAQEALADLL